MQKTGGERKSLFKAAFGADLQSVLVKPCHHLLGGHLRVGRLYARNNMCQYFSSILLAQVSGILCICRTRTHPWIGYAIHTTSTTHCTSTNRGSYQTPKPQGTYTRYAHTCDRLYPSALSVICDSSNSANASEQLSTEAVVLEKLMAGPLLASPLH
jgi:hypothetical protein